MSAVVVTAAPFFPVKPLVKLGTTPATVEISCAGGDLVVAPEQDENEVETFCGTYKSYKAEKWTIVLTSYLSYGTTGLWNTVRPLVGTTVAFQLLPDAASAVSASNPKMSGTCRVKGIPFFSGGPGEPTSFELELAVQGTPLFETTGSITLAAEEEEALRAHEAETAGLAAPTALTGEAPDTAESSDYATADDGG